MLFILRILPITISNIYRTFKFAVDPLYFIDYGVCVDIYEYGIACINKKDYRIHKLLDVGYYIVDLPKLIILLGYNISEISSPRLGHIVCPFLMPPTTSYNIRNNIICDLPERKYNICFDNHKYTSLFAKKLLIAIQNKRVI